MKARLSRRRLLAITPLLPFAMACDEESSGCPEPPPASLTEEQKKLRRAIGYVHGGGPVEKTCDKCLYFKSSGDCGTCEVMPGPVHPDGTCQLFREKS